MTDAEVDKFMKVYMPRVARIGLVTVSTYILLIAQAYLTGSYWLIALAFGLLSAMTLTAVIPFAGLALLATMVLIPPHLTSAFAAWVKSLGA